MNDITKYEEEYNRNVKEGRNIVEWIKGYLEAIEKNETIKKEQLEMLVKRVKELINENLTDCNLPF